MTERAKKKINLRPDNTIRNKTLSNTTSKRGSLNINNRRSNYRDYSEDLIPL